ncbi:helix-turn-helix domain-containing protein [Actinomadura chokoriensis]|uniref:helix-turn-helix domain-containing protein n=1 Tax=Actinomadura chokoriensis TaxID=454156 RepID=UPI003D1544E9
MSRRRLDPAAQRRGQALASRLAQARHTSGRSAEAVAHSAGISVETVRSIERGRTSTPEFAGPGHRAGVVARRAICLRSPILPK